ncbi:MAG: MarR family winged helix-turn-helix transcriptional regulator, partial [Actinomycetota bacterium]
MRNYYGMMTTVPRTRWLNTAEMRAWLAYVTTSVDLQRAIERDLEPFGLDGGDYQLLAMLSDATDRRMKMCDLADTLRLSRSGLTRRMEGVLRKKLVARVQSEGDKRVAYAV